MSEVLEAQTKDNTLRKWGLSGSTLKWIALLTMLIDHIGAALIARLIITDYQGMGEQVYGWYRPMRDIGRIAFPIYCFLLVEGFTYTRNKFKYATRLFLFALISEIPFDLAFSSKVLELTYQNVFFTLLIGFLAMATVSVIYDRIKKCVNDTFAGLLYIAVIVLISMMAMVAADALKTDYAAKGIASIMVLYLFRGTGLLQKIAGAVSFYWEEPAMLAFLPIALYNGKRGMPMKYIFYVFYPLHLLVIYLICMYLGIADCAVV